MHFSVIDWSVEMHYLQSDILRLKSPAVNMDYMTETQKTEGLQRLLATSVSSLLLHLSVSFYEISAIVIRVPFSEVFTRIYGLQSDVRRSTKVHEECPF